MAFANTPNILWRIEDPEKVHRKLSPLISFVGLRFHLIFSQFLETNGAKYQLIMECQNLPKPAPAWPFNAEVSILYNSGNRYLTKSGKYDLKHHQCCIWSEFVQTVHKTFNQLTRIDFMVMITPSGDLLSKLKTREFEETKIFSPCAISLREDFAELFNNDKYSDFTLMCGNRSFHVNKAILSVRSQYFEAMFRNDMKEKNEGNVKIEKIEPHILELVLRYIYTGEVPEISVDSVKELYAAAEMLWVEPLKVKCCSLFIDNFTTEFQEDSEEVSKVDQPASDEQKTSVEEPNEAKEREILKDLFTSREWRIFCQEFPHKAQAMCEPYLLKKL